MTEQSRLRSATQVVRPVPDPGPVAARRAARARPRRRGARRRASRRAASRGPAETDVHPAEPADHARTRPTTARCPEGRAAGRGPRRARAVRSTPLVERRPPLRRLVQEARLALVADDVRQDGRGSSPATCSASGNAHQVRPSGVDGVADVLDQRSLGALRQRHRGALRQDRPGDVLPRGRELHLVVAVEALDDGTERRVPLRDARRTVRGRRSRLSQKAMRAAAADAARSRAGRPPRERSPATPGVVAPLTRHGRERRWSRQPRRATTQPCRRPASCSPRVGANPAHEREQRRVEVERARWRAARGRRRSWLQPRPGV